MGLWTDLTLFILGWNAYFVGYVPCSTFGNLASSVYHVDDLQPCRSVYHVRDHQSSKEDKIRPFFETLNYWGIQRKRTKIKCHSCSSLVGYIYDDGPPLTDSPSQFHMGPSQVIPRSPRYRFKTKALRVDDLQPCRSVYHIHDHQSSKEDKIRPFFETLNYWGIQRKRTKIKCHGCSSLVGYIYDDGPPLTDSPGQFHMGPSQVIPRSPRYRFKTKALRVTSET